VSDLVLGYLEQRTRRYRTLSLSSAAVASIGYGGMWLSIPEFTWAMLAGLVVLVATLPVLAVNALDLRDARRCRHRIPEARAGFTEASTASASDLPQRARRRASLACALLAFPALYFTVFAAMLAFMIYESRMSPPTHVSWFTVDIDLQLLPVWLGGTGGFVLLLTRVLSIQRTLAELGASPAEQRH